MSWRESRGYRGLPRWRGDGGRGRGRGAGGGGRGRARNNPVTYQADYLYPEQGGGNLAPQPFTPPAHARHDGDPHQERRDGGSHQERRDGGSHQERHDGGSHQERRDGGPHQERRDGGSHSWVGARGENFGAPRESGWREESTRSWLGEDQKAEEERERGRGRGEEEARWDFSGDVFLGKRKYPSEQDSPDRGQEKHFRLDKNENWFAATENRSVTDDQRDGGHTIGTDPVGVDTMETREGRSWSDERALDAAREKEEVGEEEEEAEEEETTILGEKAGGTEMVEQREEASEEGGREKEGKKKAESLPGKLMPTDPIPDASPETIAMVNKKVIAYGGNLHEYFCSLCYSKLNCKKNLQKHLNSLEHTRRISSSLCVDKAVFMCRVCLCRCMNEDMFEKHCRGKKHHKNLQLSSEAKAANYRAVGHDLDAILKEHVFKEGDGLSLGLSPAMMKFFSFPGPFIGLKYAVEVGTENDPNPSFLCSLCNVSVDSGNCSLHFCSSAHRSNVLKHDYPEQYKEVCSYHRQPDITKGEFTEKVKEIATDIEAREGRKVELIKRRILSKPPPKPQRHWQPYAQSVGGRAQSHSESPGFGSSLRGRGRGSRESFRGRGEGGGWYGRGGGGGRGWREQVKVGSDRGGGGGNRSWRGDASSYSGYGGYGGYGQTSWSQRQPQQQHASGSFPFQPTQSQPQAMMSQPSSIVPTLYAQQPTQATATPPHPQLATATPPHPQLATATPLQPPMVTATPLQPPQTQPLLPQGTYLPPQTPLMPAYAQPPPPPQSQPHFQPSQSSPQQLIPPQQQSAQLLLQQQLPQQYGSSSSSFVQQPSQLYAGPAGMLYPHGSHEQLPGVAGDPMQPLALHSGSVGAQPTHISGEVPSAAQVALRNLVDGRNTGQDLLTGVKSFASAMVQNEEDAEVAFQLSSALTQALLAYRIKSMSTSTADNPISSILSGLQSSGQLTTPTTTNTSDLHLSPSTSTSFQLPTSRQ